MTLSPLNSTLKKVLMVAFGGFLVACKALDPNASLPLSTVPTTGSVINVPLDIPLATLEAVANRATPTQLFNQRGLDLGNGLIGDFEFSRKERIQFRVLDQQRMEVIFPIQIRGEIGLKPGGIRNLFQSKVPFSTILRPIFLINPTVQSNWYLAISEFELVDLGGKIGFSVLGIDLDLSPLVRQEIRRYAKQELTSKPNLIPLKPILEPLWNQVGSPIVLEVGGKKSGLSFRPDSVRVREYLQPNKGLHLDLGVIGQVQAHPSSALPSRAFPLPRVSVNLDPSNRIDVKLPVEFSYGELDSLLRKSFGEQAIPMNKTYRFKATQFRTQAYGERLGITVAFTAVHTNGGELKGELFLVGRPEYDPTSRVLQVVDLDFVMKSGSAKAMLGSLIKKGKIHRQLSQRLKLPLGETIAGSLEAIQERLSVQTPVANLSIQNLQLVPLGFYPTAKGLAVPLQATATTVVQWK